MWSILQHIAWEGPGLIGQELGGLSHRIHRLDRGEAVPDLSGCDGLIVMGGTMGVYEGDRHPFLEAEIALLAQACRRGVPMLCICLGAQLLAAALGAEVAPGPVWEIGAGEVQLTPEGERDPVLGGEGSSLPVVHWHHDTFPLPATAVALARSAVYPQQAFRVGARAYGLQFHCEVDAALAAEWREHGLELAPEDVAGVERAGRRVVRKFLSVATGAI